VGLFATGIVSTPTSDHESGPDQSADTLTALFIPFQKLTPIQRNKEAFVFAATLCRGRRMMTIQQCGYPVAISKQLTTIIDQELKAYDDDTWLGFILYFRDPVYRPGSGAGSHLVEIHIDAQQRIKIVKDYAYVGQGDSVGLAKQLDFDFFYQQFQQQGKRYPIKNGSEAFAIWQQQFCAVYSQQIYEVIIQGL
jgi:hypothetical protein